MGTTFIEDELLKRSSSGILTPMQDGDVIGLEDLIAGVTPTLTGWTVDPTDAANITDGDISTFCTTGNKVTTAYNYAYFEWDLGSLQPIICTGVGNTGTTAGDGNIYIYFWDGANWISSSGYAVWHTSPRSFTVFGGVCSKVRIGLMANADSTITPNIREFHAWKL